ncbi:PLxRFG domain-containing protein [Desulfovibrio sp. TomC]|uniref:PLxRFG domain-containing protein n=1 Tax=Desulfovibrio sp. TomC TaxID=1562888 RepID=UPI00057477F4|nr:PLxRFG domain-containing protein [Desulfovibrio sp. TomC]KHK02361.1 diguanylate cyclase/phosphodiesterase (GGDEF & EAL domains) with PAS/PAC sensor(s) [Desulfovibrio sp. TomC]
MGNPFDEVYAGQNAGPSPQTNPFDAVFSGGQSQGGNPFDQVFASDGQTVTDYGVTLRKALDRTGAAMGYGMQKLGFDETGQAVRDIYHGREATAPPQSESFKRQEAMPWTEAIKHPVTAAGKLAGDALSAAPDMALATGATLATGGLALPGVVGTVAGGAAGGAAFGLSGAERAAHEIETMPEDQLRGTPAFLDAYAKTDPNLPESDRLAQARKGAADAVARATMGANVGVGAVVGPAGGVAGGLAEKALPGLAGRVASGAVGGSSFMGGMKVAENAVHQGYIDPNTSLTEGVPDALVGGGVFGGAHGVVKGKGVAAGDQSARIDTRATADSLHGVADAYDVAKLNATSFPGSTDGNHLSSDQLGQFMAATPAGQALGKTISDLRAAGYAALADKLQITSANAGEHAPKSLHYRGEAVDTNARGLTPDEQATVAQFAGQNGLMRDVAGEPWHYSYRGQVQQSGTATAGQPAPSGPVGPAQKAADAVGASDIGPFLSRVIDAESSGDSNVKAGTSSAFGLGQLTRDTRQAVLDKYGVDAWSKDPEQQMLALAYLARDSRTGLAKSLGVEPSQVTDGQLYMTHLLGEGGARRFFTGMAANPNDLATKYISPEAGTANKSIFLAKDGRPRTLQEVYDLMAAKVAPKDGETSARPETSAPAGQIGPEASAAPESWPVRPELDALRQDMETRAPGIVEGQGSPWDTRLPADRINEGLGLDTPLGRRAELESLRQDIQGRDVAARAADEMGAPVPATEAARINERPALPEGQGFDLVPDGMRQDRLPAKLEDAPTMPAQDIRFHLNDKPAEAFQGIRPEDVAHGIKGYTEAAPGAAPVRIVRSMDELPPHILDQYRRSGETGAIEGVYDRGSRAVWLVADNLESKSRAGEIWLHENVAHHGLRAVFGSDKAFDGFLKRSAQFYGYGSDHIAMEEHIARLAEKMNVGQALTPKERSLWGKFVDYVRGWLVKHGWATPKDADLHSLLQDSLTRMARGGERGAGSLFPDQSAAFSAKEDPRQYRAFLEGEPVVRLRGDEFPRFPKLGQLAQAVGDWWAKKYGNNIQNPELGDITIDQRGAKSSVAHGMGAEKGAAFAAVPDILSKGKVIGHEIRGDVDGYFVGAPVHIAGKEYVGMALVKRDANGQRFYLHEVVLKEKLQRSIKTGAPDFSGERTGGVAGAFREILSRIFAPGKPGDGEGRFSARPEDRLEADTDAAVKSIAEGMKKDIGPLARWLGTPDYTFQKHPVAKAIYDVFRNRVNRAHEILHTALDLPDGATVMDKWKSLSEKSKAMVNQIIDVADVREIRRPAVEPWMAEQNISEPVREMYRIMRDKYDALLDERLRPYKEMLEKGVNPDIQYRDSDGKLVTMSLKEAVGEMGQMRGFYAPRIRQTGDLAVLARRKLPGGDFEYARHHVEWKRQAKGLEKELRAKGWEITGMEPVARLGEGTQQAIARLGEVAKVVESTAKGMKGVPDDAKKAFLEQLVAEISDDIKARGFRSSAIRRTGREGRVVRGYIEDAGERFAQYAQRTSYGIAKMEAAQNAVRSMFATGQDGKLLLDPRREPRTFQMVQNYLQDQLRNSEKADRVISLGKSIATFKFLGFNAKSALLNLTTLATQVPPAMRVYAGDSKVSLLRCDAELVRSLPDAIAFMLGKSRKNLSPDERAFLGEIQRKDLDDPQFAREAFKSYQATAGRVWSGAMNKSMLMFGATEQFNRLSTQLAGYRVARLAGFGHQEAMERALTASDRAHGVYGREAMPEAAWGTNGGARLMQLGYVYKKYAHNTLQLLADVWGKGDARSFMHLLAAPLALGGVSTGMGALGWAAAKAIYSTLGDSRDPKEAFFSWVRNVLGQDAEQYARFGAFGALGIDVSGSMDTQVRMPGTLKDLAGPVGGVANDLFGDQGAAHYLATGQPGKALEKTLPTGIAKPLQAMREAETGVTSSKGYPLRDEQGKNYMPTPEETTAKALGFRPAREARLKDMDQAARTEERAFQERRQDIMEAYRAFTAAGGTDRSRMDVIVSDIAKFNADVDRMDRADIQPITQRSIESSLASFRNPSKQELGRRGIGDASEADPIGPENFALAEQMVRFREVKHQISQLYAQAQELADAGRVADARELAQGNGLIPKHDLIEQVQGVFRDAAELREAAEKNPRISGAQREAARLQADHMVKRALHEFETRSAGWR